MCEGSLAVASPSLVPPLLAARDVPARRTLHLRGVVLPEGVVRDVFVVGGRITFTEPDDATTVFVDGVVIPGLVDPHARLWDRGPAGDAAPDDVRVRASLRHRLAEGILAVREPGAPNHAAIGLGPDEGLPRVQSAGRLLTPRPGLAAAVEHEARANRSWAAVAGDHPFAALHAAVVAAHAVGARLTVHASRAAQLDAAIEAGADAVEHGVGLTDDTAAALAARGITLVATTATDRDALGRAGEAGVTVVGAPGVAPTLAAASWTARAFLGLPGIAEGAPADLVAYRDDPRAPLVRILDGRLLRSA